MSVEAKKIEGPEKYLLAIRASDINGAPDVDTVEVIVNSVMDGRNACYVRYDGKARILSLLNDPGTALVGSIEIGSPKQLSNSYCAISTFHSAANGRYDVEISFELVPTAKMHDKRTIYSSVADREGLRQSWAPSGALPGDR
jgi:hypothetical protein